MICARTQPLNIHEYKNHIFGHLDTHGYEDIKAPRRPKLFCLYMLRAREASVFKMCFLYQRYRIHWGTLLSNERKLGPSLLGYGDILELAV